MSAEDNNITAAARKILASSWIDLTLIHVRTTRGVIHITGHIRRMTFEHGELHEKLLKQLDDNLREIKDVRYITYDLDNWEKDYGGSWKRILQRNVNKRDVEWYERRMFE